MVQADSDETSSTSRSLEHITVSELIAYLQKLNVEIECDGERIGAHKIKSTVGFSITNADVLYDLELIEIEPHVLVSCGCWDGVSSLI